MAEWSNGRNGYIRTIYGRHTHTDDDDDDDDDGDDDDDDDDNDDDNDTLIFYSIDALVVKLYFIVSHHVSLVFYFQSR